MTTTLDVVNDCLAIMGEAPLNAMNESHAFKAAAVQTLNRVNATVQATGWWFNMETLALLPNPQDGQIYLPTDTASLLPDTERPNLVQRGRILYDLNAGDSVFPLDRKVNVRLVRMVPLESIPNSVAMYIARRTVLEFQTLYDGDSTKTRQLQFEVYGQPGVTLGLKGEAMAEHIRYRNVNLIDQSWRLHQIRKRVGYGRPY